MNHARSNLSLLALLLATMLVTSCAGTRPEPAATMTPASTSTAAITPIPTRIDLSPDLYLRQIREDVFVVTHAFPWPANSLIVEMSNGDLVLVGTPYTPAATDQVLDWITEHFGQRKIIEINTGYHVDNLGGNSALIARGIPVYGSDLTVKLLKERGETTRQLLMKMLGPADQAYYQPQSEIPYLPPNQLFPIEAGLKLQFGDEQLQVFYPGPSQAPDKVVVYFPAKKLLFGSCLILGGEKIGNTSDADMEHWPAAVHSLEQFPVEIVVPGHGERLDPGLIKHTLDLLSAQP